MITVKSRGDLKPTIKYLNRIKDSDYTNLLEKYATEGVNALANNTPKDSGITADSWSYEIVKKKNGMSIYWTNRNIVDGVPLVILIQYGHGTKSGTFVEGRDFINPAIKPIFDKIAENIWKEVKSYG